MHHIRWCLHQFNGFLLVPNLGCSFFMKVLVYSPTDVGVAFFGSIHSLFRRGMRTAFYLLGLRLSPVPAFGASLPPHLLGF